MHGAAITSEKEGGDEGFEGAEEECVSLSRVHFNISNPSVIADGEFQIELGNHTIISFQNNSYSTCLRELALKSYYQLSSLVLLLV